MRDPSSGGALYMFQQQWSRIGGGLVPLGILILLAMLLMRWLGIVRPTNGSSFLLILGIVVLSNLLWWWWVDRVVSGSPVPAGSSRRWRCWLRGFWAGYCVLMLLPFAFFMGGARDKWEALPVPILSWTLVWHLLLAPLGCVASLLLLLTLTIRWMRRRGPWPHRDLATDPPSPLVHDPDVSPAGQGPCLSRRALLARVTAAAPLVITGGSVLAGQRQEGRFLIREVTIQVPRLPDRLKGLTITHLSDMHVGRFFRPEHLPRMVDAAHRLRSDLVVVTGDTVDHSNDFLPAAQQALAQIEAPFGRYMVIGNHDLIDEPVAAELFWVRHERYFLRDEHATIDIGGERIQIAGLFWSRGETQIGKHPGHLERTRAALTGADPERFTIALAHHPHAFDALAAAGVDLVLAGHTHGGQIMLTPPGLNPPLGAGNLLFRYIHGTYAIGRSRMYVSAGVGNWFPVRVNAPAEMVQIRLV